MQDDNSPHWAALGRGILATENLTNLGKLPTRGALFNLSFATKWEGATGGLGTRPSLSWLSKQMDLCPNATPTAIKASAYNHLSLPFPAIIEGSSYEDILCLGLSD